MKDIPKNRVPILALLSANAISVMGNMVTTVAVPLFVLQTTGSPAKTGITGAVVALPVVVAGIFGGPLVDRVGYKRASVVADIASGATVAMIPLLHLSIGIEFWQLLVLVFLGALLDAPGNTVRQSMIPELANAADMSLEQANSTFGATQRGMQLVGPLLAGVLIAALGASNALWINAATFAVSALLVASAVPSPSRSALEAETDSTYFGGLVEGARLVRSDRLILTLLISVAIINFLTAPLFAVILPVYATEVFGGALDLGLMLAGFGGGALVGTIIYGAVGSRLPRRATFVGAFLSVTIPFAVLASEPDLLIAVAALIILGGVTGPINPLLMTLFHERIPAHMRGRIFGLVMAIAWSAMPVGMLVAGYLLERIGIRFTMIAVAASFLITALGLVINPTLHHLDPLDEDRGPDITGDV